MYADQERFDEVSENELAAEIATGEVTSREIDAKLDAHMRREAAERVPDELPDSTRRMGAGGPGSGQGMAKEQTGQEPPIPPERGLPRTSKNPDWPH